MSKIERSEDAREASRRNGSKGAGPRTAAGKRRSARNALKHGLRSQSLVPAELRPAWINAIEADLLRRLYHPDFVQREYIDRLLLACQRLAKVDALIAAMPVHAGGLEYISEGGRSRDTASIASELRTLAKYHAYRRRFRGQRDRCLVRLIPKNCS